MAAATRTPLLSEDDPPDIGARIRVRCSVEVTLEQLDPASADVLRRWIDDPQITASAIERKLRDKGIEMRAGNLLRHRRGDCKCPR